MINSCGNSIPVAFLMPAMRFVQFADVHIDSNIGGAIDLPYEKKAALRSDIRTAFERACSLVISHKADILLIPGDLFDWEAIQPDTAKYLIDIFKSISPAKVFIAPGNHDSLRPKNPYLEIWPENVHIFKSPYFETIIAHDINCAVTGIAHSHRGITARAISEPIKKCDGMVNFLMFHGSRDGYKPSEKEMVIPFSDDELIGQDFDYAAIGHYHTFSEIADTSGRIKGAYSGCLQGRGLDETGEKYALVGEICVNGSVEIEKIEVAPRRILDIDVDLTGLADSAAVSEKVRHAMANSGARECDILNVNLCGAVLPQISIENLSFEANTAYFYLNINSSKLQPDYDIGSFVVDSAASSLKSAFVKKMLEMESQTADDKRQQVIRDAIYYGLGALDGRKPEPRE